MWKGDIDNLPAPAIVLDIDNLIIKLPEKRQAVQVIGDYFRSERMRVANVVSEYKLVEEILPTLEHLFFKGIEVIIFAHRAKGFREPLRELLQDNMITYSNLVVGGTKERESLLKLKKVHWYYYSKPEHSSTNSKQKERWVSSWHDVSL